MSDDRESLIASIHPAWQYVLVIAALAFIAWCFYIAETD
jgi:hypothetical protein